MFYHFMPFCHSETKKVQTPTCPPKSVPLEVRYNPVVSTCHFPVTWKSWNTSPRTCRQVLKSSIYTYIYIYICSYIDSFYLLVNRKRTSETSKKKLHSQSDPSKCLPLYNQVPKDLISNICSRNTFHRWSCPLPILPPVESDPWQTSMTLVRKRQRGMKGAGVATKKCPKWWSCLLD